MSKKLLPLLMLAATTIKGIAAEGEEFSPADHGLSVADCDELVTNQAATVSQAAPEPDVPDGGDTGGGGGQGSKTAGKTKGGK